MKPCLGSLDGVQSMSAEAEMRVEGHAEQTRPFVERNGDEAAQAVGKRDLRVNVGLARHIGREKGDVALAGRDGETFPFRPIQDLVHVRLQTLLELVDPNVGLQDVEVVGVGFAERGARGEV